MTSGPRSAATYMIGAAFAFALMTLFVRLAGRGMPSQEIVTARAGFTLLFTYVLLRRSRMPMLGNNRRLLLLRGLSGFAALSCVYYAVTSLPLAEATVIQYLHPTFTAVLASKVLGERVRRGTGTSLLLGAAGVVLIARPDVMLQQGGAALPTLGLAAAIGGALLTSCAYVIVRKLGQTEDPLVIVFYFPMVALPASIPAMVAAGAVWPTPGEWVLLLLVGISTQVGQLSITRGLQLHEVGKASVYSYTQVLFATLLGAVFLDELPTPWTLAGGALILASAVVAKNAERQPAPTRAAAPRA
ncbi:MAG: DMT family transporter [Myxococcales bacterium]|jgi:drug/metabolite transporter (DMT)-like permease